MVGRDAFVIMVSPLRAFDRGYGLPIHRRKIVELRGACSALRQRHRHRYWDGPALRQGPSSLGPLGEGPGVIVLEVVVIEVVPMR